jgi:oligopeptide transport system permease protein
MAEAFAAAAPVQGLWTDAWQRLRRSRAAIVAATLLLLVIVLSVAGPWLSAYTVEQVDWSQATLATPPSLSNGHWFGTDANGRDLFVRVWIGTRMSLLVALLSTLVSVMIGVAWGATAGYLGGRVDDWMMRFVDVLYALPYMFFVIILTVVFGRSLVLIFLAIGAVGWLTMARIVRGQALALRHHRAPHRAERARHGDRLRHAHGAAGHPVRKLPELPRPRRAGAAHEPRPAGG